MSDLRDLPIVAQRNQPALLAVIMLGGNDARRGGFRSLAELVDTVTCDLFCLYHFLQASHQRVLVVLPPPSPEEDMAGFLEDLHTSLKNSLPCADVIGMCPDLTLGQGYSANSSMFRKLRNGRLDIHLNHQGASKLRRHLRSHMRRALLQLLQPMLCH